MIRLLFLLSFIGCAGVRHHPAEGALGPYSGSVAAGGLVFCSGKIGERDGPFGREVETALGAVEAELARSGRGLKDAVSVAVFLTDMRLYPELNAIYARRFPKPYPARTTVGVASLPGNARVEISVVAR